MILTPAIRILFIRRIVQLWYTRIGDAEGAYHPQSTRQAHNPCRAEKQLVSLRKQQREKIEEIKKKTNYYSTRTLIERYDDGPGAETPLRRRLPAQVAPGTPAPNPQRPVVPQPPKLVTPQTPAKISSNLQQQLSRKRVVPDMYWAVGLK